MWAFFKNVQKKLVLIGALYIWFKPFQASIFCLGSFILNVLKIFRKTNIYPLIRARTSAYQGVNFSETCLRTKWMIPFVPRTYQETAGLQMFSDGMKTEHWLKMG